MEEHNSKRMWSAPWRYRESAAVVAGIVVVGWILQICVGGVHFAYLAWPVNIGIGAIVVLSVAAISLFRGGVVQRWVAGVPLSACLIGSLLVLGIIMGLIPQMGDGHHHHGDFLLRMGFGSVTSSWAFVLVYLFTLIALGCVIVNRMGRFRWRDYAFYLNHIGLWLALFAAGLGAADMKRYVMYVREGEVEWRVYNEQGDVLELPIAIELFDFDMEEYPPRLAVIDRATGEAQPEGKPVFFQLDPREPEGVIGRWDIFVEQYIHQAVRNSDSTYHEVGMPGSAPAARVRVTDRMDGRSVSGWVCAGNIAQLYMVLNLDEQHAVVMTSPEPKRYMSDINIYTEDGRSKHALLEVNSPARVGHWSLYQYTYDTDAGRMSTYSGIELVYDPWLVPVYIGLGLLMAGSVCMLWQGRRRKEGCNDVE